jgi:hypothetical protein
MIWRLVFKHELPVNCSPAAYAEDYSESRAGRNTEAAFPETAPPPAAATGPAGKGLNARTYSNVFDDSKGEYNI